MIRCLDCFKWYLIESHNYCPHCGWTGVGRPKVDISKKEKPAGETDELSRSESSTTNNE